MPLPDWWRSIISIYASTCFGYQQPQQVKNRLAPLKSILASKAQTGFWENIQRNAARRPHQNALNGVFTSNSLAAFLPQDFPPLSNYKWLRNARLETPVPRDFLSCQLDCLRIEILRLKSNNEPNIRYWPEDLCAWRPTHLRSKALRTPSLSQRPASGLPSADDC